MKAITRDGLARQLEKLAEDLASAKECGAAKAAELGRTDPLSVTAFELAWTERMCAEGSARIHALVEVYLTPKRARRAA